MPIKNNSQEVAARPTTKVVEWNTSAPGLDTGISTVGPGADFIKSLPEGTVLPEGKLAFESPETTDTTQPVEANPQTESTPGIGEKPTSKDREARALFIKAQKAERSAQARIKRAEEMTAKADKFEKALSDPDPTAKLTALGLNPHEVYEALTKYALKQMETKEAVDPIAEMRANYDKKLQEMADTMHKQQIDATNKENTHQEVIAIQSKFIPLLANNPEKYEALIEYAGNGDINQAAIYGYNQVKRIWMENNGTFPINTDTNQPVTPEEIFDGLEQYHDSLTETAIKKALKMKKFSKYGLAPQIENSDEKRAVSERPLPTETKTLKTTQTLSTKLPQITQSIKNENDGSHWAPTREERLRKFMEQYK
jgi:hypothetical protein